MPALGPFLTVVAMRRQLKVAIVIVVAVAALAACAEPSQDLSSQDAVLGTQVDVVDNEFEPAVLRVEPGATVTWTWRGSNPHNVVSDGFESETQTTGTFNHTFQQVGEYPYVCAIHPGMEGLVVVEQ